MNAREATALIPMLMRVEFEGAPWSWLVDPAGNSPMPWLAEVGPVAETFGPADSYPETSLRVLVHCNDPTGDGLFPQIHFKIGVLKDIPDHPDLPSVVNALNTKAIFGRLQLHTGQGGERAVTCEHYVAAHRHPPGDVALGQVLLDTLGMVRNRCAAGAGEQIRAAFGGEPFSGGADGGVLVMAG